MLTQKSMVFKVFLDVNVLLDFLLKRKDFDEIKHVLLAAKKRQVKLYVSPSMIQTVSYYLQQSYSAKISKSLLIEILKLFNIIESSHETIHQALNSPIDDIEDAIHYFAAIRHKMDFLISSDQQFQKVVLSNLPVLSISEITKRLGL